VDAFENAAWLVLFEDFGEAVRVAISYYAHASDAQSTSS
jgi:hypothetical protein